MRSNEDTRHWYFVGLNDAHSQDCEVHMPKPFAYDYAFYLCHDGLWHRDVVNACAMSKD